MRRKDASRRLRLRDFDFDVKAVDDGGADGYRLVGYGSVFGVMDSYREIVDPGAFSESLAAIKAKDRPLPMLWQHRSAEPLGVWDVLEERDRGLYLEGNLIKGVQKAEEARLLAKAKAVSGLSIGYWVRDDSHDEVARVTHLKRLDLVETSLVTFPANDEARVDGVKFFLSNGQLPAVKEFEHFLRREAGLSRTQASLVVTKGFAELHRRESGASDDDAGLKSALDELRSAAAEFGAPLFP